MITTRTMTTMKVMILLCYHYQRSSSAIQLEAKCNQACNCTRIMFDPVCGGPLTYFSPCHAGCGEIEHYHNKVLIMVIEWSAIWSDIIRVILIDWLV